VTLGQVTTLVYQLVGAAETDPDPTLIEVRNAIAQMMRLWCWLTLSYEASGVIAIDETTVGSTFTAADFIAPIRIDFDGRRLDPVALAHLDAGSASWIASRGRPSQVCWLSPNLFLFDRVPTGTSFAAIRYAAIATDISQIPADRHELIALGAAARVRLKEGGQYFPKTLEYLDRFVDGVAIDNARARARSVEQGHMTQPLELNAGKVRKQLERLRARPKPE
jgi:hypothetical protein